MQFHEIFVILNYKKKLIIFLFPYSRPISLKAHIESFHKGIKPQHHCKICEKSFVLKQNLKSHFINRHTEREPNHCDMCGKNFTLRSTLKVHIHEVHEGKKDHQCDFCDKVYTRKFELKKHMRKVHEGENNGKIKCDICGITFMTMAHLQTHYSKIHKKGENIVWIPSFEKNVNGHGMIFKEFECNNIGCGAKFKSTDDLLVHNASEHFEFECSIIGCGAKFKSTDDLFVHNDSEHFEEEEETNLQNIDLQFDENFDDKKLPTIISNDPPTMIVSMKTEPPESVLDESSNEKFGEIDFTKKKI